MSLADDVLARHVEAFCNLCKPTHSRGTCRVCFTEAWPCESVRLATQLRAAEQVVDAAEKVTDYFHDDYEEVLRSLNERIANYRLAL